MKDRDNKFSLDKFYWDAISLSETCSRLPYEIKWCFKKKNKKSLTHRNYY